jgi:predicted regulator of Ras-like GTPase activity (Roadblock/LC7/MglB family)
MDNLFWLSDEKILEKFEVELNRLKVESNAKATFLIDKNGQLIGSSKNTENYDKTSIGALVAGNVAATGGLANLLGEKEFSILFHEGENEHVHISLVAGKLILVVIFDETTSLGLIRLRVKKSLKVFEKLLRDLEKSSQENNRENIFSDITEDDIDNLFNIGGK